MSSVPGVTSGSPAEGRKGVGEERVGMKAPRRGRLMRLEAETGSATREQSKTAQSEGKSEMGLSEQLSEPWTGWRIWAAARNLLTFLSKAWRMAVFMAC